MSDVPVQREPQSASPATFDPFRAFRAEMDRMFGGFGLPSMRRFFEGDGGFRMPAAFAGGGPAVDVTEDDKAYHIAAELPGLSESDVQVALNGDMLTLRGEKKQDSEKKDANYYIAERSYGSFQRSFAVPENVDRDKIEAQFSKGVLTLTLPKSTETASRQKSIEIKPD